MRKAGVLDRQNSLVFERRKRQRRGTVVERDSTDEEQKKGSRAGQEQGEGDKCVSKYVGK